MYDSEKKHDVENSLNQCSILFPSFNEYQCYINSFSCPPLLVCFYLIHIKISLATKDGGHICSCHFEHCNPHFYYQDYPKTKVTVKQNFKNASLRIKLSQKELAIQAKILQWSL